MSTIEELAQLVGAHRLRIKSLEEIVTQVQRSSRDSAGSLRRLEAAEDARVAAAATAAEDRAEGFRAIDAFGAEDESETSSSAHRGRFSDGVLTALDRHVLHTEVAEQSPWFQALFPETCIYTLPVGAVKSGRIPVGCFDPILAELVRRGRASAASSRDSAAYQAYSSEWPVLNQSITYQVIQAEAVSELLVFVNRLSGAAAEQVSEVLASADLGPSLEKLLLLQCAVLDDQTKRASVLIAAARKSVSVAYSISNQLGAEVSGVHPSVEAAYAAARSVPEHSSGQASAAKSSGKSSSSGGRWPKQQAKGDKPVASSSAKTPPASAAKRAKSPGAAAPP